MSLPPLTFDMAERSAIVPIALKGKKTEDLSRQLLEVQAKAGGKVSIVSIYFDTNTKEHVLWYLPLRSMHGNLM